jgi:hypothetical protein
MTSNVVATIPGTSKYFMSARTENGVTLALFLSLSKNRRYRTSTCLSKMYALTGRRGSSLASCADEFRIVYGFRHVG